jgi:dipeptidyl aminopeptidase/acylaminoacyl peptidase
MMLTAMQPESPSPSKPAPRRAGVALVGICMALTALIGFVGWRIAPPRPDETFTISSAFAGQAATIHVEAFHPLGDDKLHPAIVLLHGVEGPQRYRGERYQTANMLRDQGYAVFVVHYFDSVEYDDLYLLTEEGELDVAAVDRHCAADSRLWIEAVVDSVEAISQRPGIDPQRIAIDGYSLGGFIALSAAEQCESRSDLAEVRAVVVNWGACFPKTRFSASFPPTLFVHGERDAIVPLQSARDTIALLENSGARAELCVVPNAPHIASGDESRAATLRFLESRLKAAAE